MILISDLETAESFIAVIDSAFDYPNQAIRTETCAVPVPHPSDGTVMVEIGQRAQAVLSQEQRDHLIEWTDPRAVAFRQDLESAALNQ